MKTAALKIFLLSLFVTVMAVSLCSCSKNANRELMATDFTCKIDAQYKDMSIKGTLTRYTAGSLLLEVEEPSNLKGLSMEWNGSNVNVSLHGLSFDVNADTIPQSALGNIIGTALDSAQSMDKDSEMTRDGLLTRGESAMGDYELLSDPDTGHILSVRVPSQELTADFSDIVSTKEEDAMADYVYEYVLD